MKRHHWHISFLFILLALFVLFSFWVFRYAPDYLIELGKARKYDIDKTGTTGDTFGGTLSPLIAWLASLLTFAAFWVQYRANEQQKNYIKQQRFEDTFFRLLENHQKIIEGMDLVKDNNNSETIANGRDCFKKMYKNLIKTHKENYNEDYSIQLVNVTYNQIQDFYKSDLHHYFRFLYHILKFIKHADIDEKEKYRYSSILRATLSAYEIVFIFYNCLHKYGISHFKPLVEEFSFLKNLDDSLMLSQDHEDNFHPIAFSSSKDRAKWLKDWRIKQKESL